HRSWSLTIPMIGLTRLPKKKKSSPTLNTSAMRRSVGSVGKSWPRSIFESMAGERPGGAPHHEESHLLFQPDRPDLRTDRISLEALSQRGRQHPFSSLNRAQNDAGDFRDTNTT